MTNQELAQALVNRGRESVAFGEAELLFDAAKKLDSTINAIALKEEWLNAWLERAHKARKSWQIK